MSVRVSAPVQVGKAVIEFPTQAVPCPPTTGRTAERLQYKAANRDRPDSSVLAQPHEPVACRVHLGNEQPAVSTMTTEGVDLTEIGNFVPALVAGNRKPALVSEVRRVARQRFFAS